MSDVSLTPIPTSHPEKMIKTWKAELEPMQMYNWAATEICRRAKWRNLSYVQYSKTATFWDPTWEFKSFQNWRGRPLNYKVNFLLLFISCLLGCFAKPVSVLRGVWFILQAPFPLLVCVHCILFCKLLSC